MTQNPSDQGQNTGNQKKTCNICHQSFNSDRELQEHNQTAHSQRKQGESQSDTSQDQSKREKIA